MGIKDPHDSREFTHFAKMNADGTVAAIVEVADEALKLSHPSQDGQVYIDVTAIRKQKTIDVLTITVKPSDVATAKAALNPMDQSALLAVFVQSAAVAVAEADADVLN